jgi:hypothetical protein
MKRVFISMILAIMAIVGFSQTVGDAIYFYRNDGDFNAFFREEIDSIMYSNYDADSIYYDDVMTQLVYTVDSVYRIPLAVIDSVSFVNPEVILQPDVIVMTEPMLSYLVRRDGMTLIFDLGMPQGARPQVGNVLYAYTPNNTILGEGFAGRVIEVKSIDGNIQVVCDNLNDLRDIFQQLITIQKIYHPTSNSRTEINRESEIIPVSINATLSYDDVNVPNAEYSMSLGIEGEYHASFACMINLVTFMFDFKFEHNWKYTSHYTFKSNKDFEVEGKEHKAATKYIMLPTPWGVPFPLELDFTWKLFVKAEGSAELDVATSSPKYCYKTQIKRDEKTGFSGSINNIKEKNGKADEPSFEESFSLNGSIGGGVKVGISLGPPSFCNFKIPINIEADLAIGPKLSGNFIMKTTEDNFYEMYKDSKFTLSLLNIDAELYGVLGKKKPEKPFLNSSLPSPWTYEWYLLPEFEDLKVSTNAFDKKATISVIPKHDLFLSLPVGIGIYDSENEPVEKYESVNYKREDQNMIICQTFSSLSTDKTYVARPLVKTLFKKLFTIPATPTQVFKLEEKLCPDEHHPHAIDLGLPSGKKWTCCNMGASKPEDYGTYYSWASCSATANVPTEKDYNELFNSCQIKEKIINGVKGVIYIGTNNNCIFFPNAGSVIQGNKMLDGEVGNYWTSTVPDLLIGTEINGFSFFETIWGIFGVGMDISESDYPIRQISQ